MERAAVFIGAGAVGLAAFVLLAPSYFGPMFLPERHRPEVLLAAVGVGGVIFAFWWIRRISGGEPSSNAFRVTYREPRDVVAILAVAMVAALLALIGYLALR